MLIRFQKRPQHKRAESQIKNERWPWGGLKLQDLEQKPPTLVGKRWFDGRIEGDAFCLGTLETKTSWVDALTMTQEPKLDPLHQFDIISLIHIDLGGIDASFSNSALWMVISVAVITLMMTVGISKRAMVPGRLQALSEMAYEFIANMLRENVGSQGSKFFPFIFSLFMFILFGNLLGLIPFSFTFTSHIFVTFALALVVFVLVTFVGLARHGLHFFTYFFPSGAPVAMAPLIVPIEVISYLSRPVSLSIRLFANMMAGHTMLKVFAGFSTLLLFNLGIGAEGDGTFLVGFLAGLAPMVLNVALTGFEILVAVLQAYVFTILTCIYLHDAIHLH